MEPDRCNVLVVEDEPAVLRLVTSALGAAGFFHVSCRTTIESARQCWNATGGGFDLLVADFSLPDGPAAGFIDELLRAQPNLSVLLITGCDEEVLEEPLRARVKLLQKPFLPSELISALQGQIELPAR